MSAPTKIYRRSELEALRPQIDAEGCLHRFKAIWIDGVDDTSDVALLGIGFHAIAHAYIVSLVENNLGQDEELAATAFEIGSASAQTPSRLLRELRDLWFWFAESFELDVARFVTAEERGHGREVAFAPDLVLAIPEDNVLEIVDFKTGWMPPLTEEQVRGLFQARVYSKYAQYRWPNFSGYRFTLNAIRFRKSVSVVFSPSELDAVEQEVQAAIRTIEEAKRTDQWPATPGPSCHFCQLSCPVAEQAVALPIRLAVDQIPKLASWLLVAEKQVKAAKKLLKGAVTQYGPVTVNGVRWENRATESNSYPVQAVMDVLQLRGGMGAFEDKSLTLSKSALSKLFKKFPGLEDDLANVVQTKTLYRFGAAKPGGDDDED